MIFHGGSEASETHLAMRLMECIIANSAAMYAALDALYVELKIGGGFFRGRNMPREIDERTRYELVGYITAMAAVLVREASPNADEANSIVAALEKLVFLPEWHAAHPVHLGYVARYRDISPIDPTVVPRQKVLLIRLRQALIDVWSVSPSLLLEDGLVQRYCEALTALHDEVERRVLKELSRQASERFDHVSH